MLSSVIIALKLLERPTRVVPPPLGSLSREVGGVTPSPSLNVTEHADIDIQRFVGVHVTISVNG